MNRELVKVSVNATRIIRLNSKQEWIKYIPKVLPARASEDLLLFVDIFGNILTIGRDFIEAENKQTYPVDVYLVVRTSSHQAISLAKTEPEPTEPKFPIKFQLASKDDCTWKPMEYPKLRYFRVSVHCKKCKRSIYNRFLELPVNCAHVPFDPEHYVPYYDNGIRRAYCASCAGTEFEYSIDVADDLPF
jgi:hypothetical protein